MELDRAHLHASHEPVSIVDVEVGFLVAVPLEHPYVVDCFTEAAGVVLLEEGIIAESLSRRTLRPGG